MIRLYVLGVHPMAWGCVGCRESWMEARRRSETGRLRFRVYAEGQTVEHDYGPRRLKSLLHVREVPGN